MIDGALFGEQPRLYLRRLPSGTAQAVGFAVLVHQLLHLQRPLTASISKISVVRPPHRGKGLGKALLVYLAGSCVDNGWSRLQWCGARLERAVDRVLQIARRRDDGRLDAVPRHRRPR